MSGPEIALVASMILLTLHPLPDGNGRTARHLFAALLLKSGYSDPAHLSAFVECFSGGALSLQLALKALRMGKTSLLLDLYRDAHSSAASELAQIHAALPFGSVDGCPAIELLRTHWASRML